MMETKQSPNPWLVTHLEEFLYYCCPECNNRNQSKDQFLEHALIEHPHAQEYLTPFQNIKEEPIHQEESPGVASYK